MVLSLLLQDILNFQRTILFVVVVVAVIVSFCFLLLLFRLFCFVVSFDIDPNF